MPEVDQDQDGEEEVAAAEPVKRPGKFRVHVVISSALIIFAIAALTRVYVLEAVLVEGRSMMPTFEPDTRLVALKLPWVVNSLRRGDVVILREPMDGTIVVKRVIGLPGERVQFRRGIVFINGQKLDEPYINKDEPDRRITGNLAGSRDGIIVLGDNRNHSVDSRNYGPVPPDDIIGRVSIVVWPLDESRLVGR